MNEDNVQPLHWGLTSDHLRTLADMIDAVGRGNGRGIDVPIGNTQDGILTQEIIRFTYTNTDGNIQYVSHVPVVLHIYPRSV